MVQQDKTFGNPRLTGLEIFENNFLHERPEMAFAHMEVRVDSQASEIDGQITYLYK